MKIRNIEIKDPIFLAPISGYTDLPYRRIIWETGWEVAYTEMISAQAVLYNNKLTLKMLETSPNKKKLGLQLVGSKPQVLAEAAGRLEEKVFMVDINMGCPVKKVTKIEAGSALLGNPELVRKIIKAVVNKVSVPVSVKIRTGLTKLNINAPLIAKIAEDEGASMVTVHGRTKSQHYAGDIDYNTIRKVKELLKIPVIGNGNIYSGKDALKMIEETGVDGVMVARGALGNPWIFSEIKHYLSYKQDLNRPSVKKIKETLFRHFEYMCDYYGENMAVRHLRKIAGLYFKGVPNIRDFRREINTLTEKEKMLALIKEL